MKILFLADDYLFPTNSGGRAVARAEVEHLIALGHVVEIIVMHRAPLDSEADVAHQKFQCHVFFQQRRSIVHQTLTSPFKPYQLGSRRLPPKTTKSFRTRGYDVIWASHEWMLDVAHEIAKDTDTRIILRSHNDEYRYMLAQSRDGALLRRLYSLAEAVRLRGQLARLLRVPDSILLISESDAPAYARCDQPVSVLRPSFGAPADAANLDERRDSVLFIGALDMPHAVEGLTWFVDEVWPAVRSSVPNARLDVVGRAAPAGVRARLGGVEGVRFLGEVADLEPLYGNARVFINPVFSGSGLNMKIGPPALRGIPVTTTSFGARGYPSELLVTADSPDEFGRAVTQLLTSDDFWTASALNSRELAAHYSSAEAERVMAESLAICAQQGVR